MRMMKLPFVKSVFSFLAKGGQSTVTLNGSWSNTGTLSLTGGTLNLGGTVTPASIGTVSNTGGTINLTGTLNNTTLTLNSATGSWNLSGGTLKGGSYTASGGSYTHPEAAGLAGTGLAGTGLAGGFAAPPPAPVIDEPVPYVGQDGDLGYPTTGNSL